MKKLIMITGIILLIFSTGVFGWQFAVISDFTNLNHLKARQSKIAQKTLQDIADQNPEFVLVPGDLVMGRWFITEENVRSSGNKAYKRWRKRFNRYGLKAYPAIGDHELGDLPAINIFLQGYLLPTYKDIYQNNFNLPTNGPKEYKELAYYFIKNKTLFITLQTFNINGWFVKNTIPERELIWFKRILKKYNNKVNHIIVQGHLPILPIKGGQKTSGLILKNGSKSKLWQVMKKLTVDYYLCGEFHTTSIKQKDGITQIVTNGFIGTNKISYAIFSIDKKISYKIKVI